MGRKFSGLAAVVLLALGAMLVATPAQAHNYQGWGWCQGSPQICTAKDASGYGNHSFLQTGIGFCRNMPWNDEVSSLDSHIGTPVQFWRDAGCNGARYTLAPWATIANLSGTGYNDTFSSYCVGTVTGTADCRQYLP